MLRYRCPQCAHLLQAHELRAGKKSVCVACLSSHIIPIDRSGWLSESGEPLFAPSSHPAESLAPPAATPAPQASPAYSDPVSSSESGTPEPVITHVSGAGLEQAAAMAPAARIWPTPMEAAASDGMTADAAVAEGDLRELSAGSVGVLEGEPLPVKTQADIAAALSVALASRMKPPRRAQRDLRPSTALWLLLTGLGIAFFFVSLFSTNYSRWIAGLGLIEMFAGYAWIVLMAASRNPWRGVLCALPPATCYFLGQRKYARFRPLRFVGTGLVLVALALTTTSLSSITGSWLGRTTQHAHQQHSQDPADMSKLEKVRDYLDHKAYKKLIDLLNDLAKTDTMKSVDAKEGDGPELANELKQLCSHPDTGVRVAAMGAYCRWGGGDDARILCLKAIESPSQEVRLKALELLPQWKNTEAAHEVARAIAALIGRPGIESSNAVAALREIGGVPAERAALAVLLRADDLPSRLIALTTLGEVGGEETVVALQDYAKRSLDQTIKAMTLEMIEKIRQRQNNP